MSDNLIQRCGCCSTRPIVAVARPADGVLEVKKTVHGTSHVKEFPLSDLVNMLDPKGTSFTAV